MERFTLPEWVQQALEVPKVCWEEVDPEFKRSLKEQLSRFRAKEPVISIAIIAWNEEKNLPRTLYTLSKQVLALPAEILVVNNNSTDETVRLCEELGVRLINERKQGIAYARQTALIYARGEIHLCCDADTLYPPNWAMSLVIALRKPGIKLAYGGHSFLPEGSNNRLILGCYELIAERVFAVRKYRREYLNVRGPNFGFYRSDGLSVKGFELKHTRSMGDRSVVYGEDSKMARKIGEIGQLKHLKSNDARVYTSHRQLSDEGNLAKVFLSRMIREGLRLPEYVVGFRKPIQTSDQI